MERELRRLQPSPPSMRKPSLIGWAFSLPALLVLYDERGDDSENDDTTHVVTDARQTTTTYGYNNRHQITSLTYNVSGDPAGQTTATSNVSFGYDAAGNRTAMSDGLGAASYVYNNLAQMSSETRTFTGLSSYTLSYGYNLAGELSSVTNPWGAQVGYGYDKAGRLQNVSGSGYAGVSNYASSLSYRAFGAIKGMNYGDGHSLSTGYDNRLRATTWNVSGVLGYNYTYNDTYLHESTGRVTYAQNIYDSTLDRSYEYDHVGRLAISHSGTEARAHVFDGNLWGTMDGPYSQGYDYDVWGNVTHKYGWGGEVQGGGAGQSSDIYYSYTGNRRNGFGYDAAGNVTNDGTQTFLYDATGQQTYASGLGAGGSAPTFTDDPLNPPNQPKTDIKLVHLTELRSAVNALRVRAGLAAFTTWNPDPNPTQPNVTLVHHDHITQLRTKLEEALTALHLPVGGYAHSGPNQGDPIYAVDFQELRDKIKGAWTALASSSLSQSYDGEGLRVKKTEYGWTTWYLRSSVLGGQVIAEVDGNNVWQRGYVYAGSNLMAVQQSGVFWMHEDPVTKSKRTTDINGNTISSVELDPWGADTNRSSSAAFQPRKYTSYDRDGNGTDDAMFRRYNRMNSRFDQPDPYEGSYDFTNPQSFNRYAYTQNDPVSFVDPSGLLIAISHTECTSVTIDGETSGSCRTIWTFVDIGNGPGGGGGREPGGGGGGGGPQKPGQNPNCIERSVEGGRLAGRGLEERTSSITGPSGFPIHDGEHVLVPPGTTANVTALPLMAGRILHSGRQTGDLTSPSYPYSVVDILLNTLINGQQYVMTLKDMFYDTGKLSGSVNPGDRLGSVEGHVNPNDEAGLHVTLYPYSVYKQDIQSKGFGPAARSSVPFKSLMSAGHDPQSPFRCP